MSIATIITRGYGSFAGVNFIPTKGYLPSGGGGSYGGPGVLRRKRGQPGQVSMGQSGRGGYVDYSGTN